MAIPDRPARISYTIKINGQPFRAGLQPTAIILSRLSLVLAEIKGFENYAPDYLAEAALSFAFVGGLGR